MTNGKTFWIVLFGSLALFFASGSLFAGLAAFIGGLAFIRWKEFDIFRDAYPEEERAMRIKRRMEEAERAARKEGVEKAATREGLDGAAQ